MFSNYNLAPSILHNLEELGYAQPTQVQAEAIPAVLGGRNLVVTAETGSGKTAAFLVPMIQGLLSKPGRQIGGLVLCPTREIALQTTGFAQSIGQGTGVRAASIYGGVGYVPQETALRNGTEIIVATPGRLLDLLQKGNVNLKGLSFLVIDEADRLMDMGFLPDLRRVLQYLPATRQTMLFSATMPPEIMQLVKTVMTDPVRIEVGTVAMPPEAIDQTVFPVDPSRKTDLLLSLLKGEINDERDTVLIFCRTKRRADRLASDLRRAGHNVTAIHGDRSQAQRETALAGFRKGKFSILVATDVAARGLDVEGITHVINFDLPDVAEVYVHRIGRTARAGATGKAFSFATPEDRANLSRIEKTLEQRIARLTISDYAGPRAGATASHAPVVDTRVVSTTATSSSARRSTGARPITNWNLPK
jgi:ATP-dependent RNA helicase RhlE